MDENNFKEKEIMIILNELRKNREKMVFIGGNYEKDDVILKAIKEAIKEAGFIPIIAREVFKGINPSKIHDESLRLLHNCGFAVIDITNPAGQLMELERAKDYGVITFVSYSSNHPSKMPVALLKMMENWGWGYLFRYEDINGLKKFVRNILTINYSKMTSEEVLKTIIEAKKFQKILLITSIGVLKTEEKTEEAKNLFKNFDKKIIITGWDFKTKGEKEAKKHDVNSIVCEGCILYTRLNNRFHEIRNFCDETSLRFVKIANKYVIHAVNEYCNEKNLGQVLFFSQADEKSICYYLNPPKNIYKKLINLREKKSIQINEFVEKVKERCGIAPENILQSKLEYKKPVDLQAEENLLYAIEKVNAIYRTFNPYSLIINKNKIILDINPDNGYSEFSYRDIENIVDKVFTKIGNYFEETYSKVLPQRDICIDILCKTKEEILIPLLEEIVKDKNNTLIIYLSKGTESDIPMILKGYSSGYNFVAIGEDDIPERLKRAGVIPLGKSITTVIKKLLKIVK